MTLFKDKLSGEWVRGYPYMQWPLDKKGNRLMPGDWFWTLRIRSYDYEYIVADSPIAETSIATEYKDVSDRNPASERNPAAGSGEGQRYNGHWMT